MSYFADVQSDLEMCLYEAHCVEDWWLDYDGDVNNLPDVMTVKIKLKK